MMREHELSSGCEVGKVRKASQRRRLRRHSGLLRQPGIHGHLPTRHAAAEGLEQALAGSCGVGLLLLGCWRRGRVLRVVLLGGVVLGVVLWVVKLVVVVLVVVRVLWVVQRRGAASGVQDGGWQDWRGSCPGAKASAAGMLLRGIKERHNILMRQRRLVAPSRTASAAAVAAAAAAGRCHARHAGCCRWRCHACRHCPHGAATPDCKGDSRGSAIAAGPGMRSPVCLLLGLRLCRLLVHSEGVKRCAGRRARWLVRGRLSCRSAGPTGREWIPSCGRCCRCGRRGCRGGGSMGKRIPGRRRRCCCGHRRCCRLGVF